MLLTVVGSSDAVNAGGRGNSCYLLESPGAGKLMVDFGPTALLGLRRLGVAPVELGGLVFTHLHGDHTGGFPVLCIDTMFGGAAAPALRVLGPPLTDATLSSLFRATYGELERELSTRMSLQIEELSPGDERSFQGYRIRAFAADHMAPPHQALCLRISDAHGKTIAFSGDTRICPGLLAAADGADWLVADCSRLAPPAGPHATWAEWQPVLPTLRARSLLLTHLGADMRQRAPTLLDGLELPLPVRVADDGLVIEV
jgi:ribonuclease BN (tRNA processing enzyme)